MHPEVGDLRLAYEALELSGEDQRLMVLLPADDKAAEGLERLAGRHPGALRVVEG